MNEKHGDRETIEPEGPRLVRLYERLLTARIVDELLVDDQREGKIPSFPSARGEEVPAVCAGAMVDTDDALFPSHRDWPAAVARGMDLALLFAQAYGKAIDPAGGRRPPGYVSSAADRIVSPTAVVGNHLGHAAGWGWAARSKNARHVAVALFGDGATSSADFHNALNFAGVFKANVVFVCKNNGYAVSTPVAQQTAVESLADKAVAYGITGDTCDGNDVQSTHAAIAGAIARARSGQGPTLIEARVVPFAQDPSQCPVAGTKRLLVSLSAWSEERDEALVASCRARVHGARERALSLADVAPASFLEHVYSTHIRLSAKGPS